MTRVIKRDGEAIGAIDCETLAERIDGMELHNGANDPAYERVHEYTVEP